MDANLTKKDVADIVNTMMAPLLHKFVTHKHNGADSLKVEATDLLGNQINGQIPLGGIFMSTVSDDPFNLLGYGAWQAYAEGQFPVGFLSGDPNFGTLGGTGGVTDVTLTTSQIPAHSHKVNSGGTGGALDSGVGTAGFNAGGSGTVTSVQNNTGGGGSHTNIPPYVTMSIWERIG